MTIISIRFYDKASDEVKEHIFTSNDFSYCLDYLSDAELIAAAAEKFSNTYPDVSIIGVEIIAR